MPLKLSEEQRLALERGGNRPVELVDEADHVYFLVPGETYAKVAQLLEMEEIDPSLFEAEDIDSDSP